VDRTVDVLVVGAGPGGYPAAIRSAQLGKKVLLVERDRLGGECLNYGCIPSKALIHTANIVSTARKAEEYGIEISDIHVDMKKLQDWKGSVVERLTSGVAQLCKGNGVEVLHGDAAFTSASEVHLKTSYGEEAITFGNAIIATGGRPTDIPTFRFDGKRIISTKEALELLEIPKRLLVIGGGVSGLELGTFYAKMGSQVTVVELLDQLLPGVDTEVVRVIGRSLRKMGVAFHTSSQAKSWKEASDGLLVDAETPNGPLKIPCDIVLVTVGRRANTDGLAPEKAGIEVDKKGHVLVDKQMRTSNPKVFACGDVVGPPYLAHKATKEGIIAAEVIAGHPMESDYRALPAAIFTDPEIAIVGWSEAQAKEQGFEPLVGKVPFAAIGRALTAGEPDGFVKLIADAKSKRLLGGVIVGPDASDLISELALAIEMGASVEDLALTIHPHPTFPEAIMESAEAALGRAIHVLNRRP
jgi:dihydrolipoamide dehydrogenase